jgi:hypothetical protein
MRVLIALPISSHPFILRLPDDSRFLGLIQNRHLTTGMTRAILYKSTGLTSIQRP